jgi:hypothetical protein
LLLLVSQVTLSSHQLTSTLSTDAKPINDENDVPSCFNIKVLDLFIRNTNLLDCIGKGARLPKDKDVPARLLTTIQLVLSNRSISFYKPFGTIFGFPDAQFAAYLPAAHAKGSLFSDTAAFKVNVEWCLNIVNFFRHHLIGREECSLIDAYRDLDTLSNGHSLPQYWKEQLTDGESTIRKPLGKNWKGTYGKRSQWN